MKAKIGDWVRFLQDNTFVIGKVEYLGRKHATMGARYHTDVGSVFDEYVLEVRSADTQATVSDPYPDTKENEAIVRDFLDDEARKRGHENWVVAYHEVPGGGDGE